MDCAELDIARGYAAGTSAPSTIAKSVTNFIKSQEGHPIYNGRQGRIGPSVTLFSSPLAHFAEDMKHVDDYTYEDETDYDGDNDEGDSEAISKALLQVIAAVSDIHTKEVLLARDINDNLSLLLGARIHQSKNSNSDREPDGRTVANPACAPSKSATVGVIVFKLGIAAGDALVQASAIWRDEAFCDAYKCFQTVSACPAFLVSLQGQYLSIQGAVLIPRPVTEHLTDTIYMGLGAPCEQRVRRLRRILRIFRKAHRALRNYYVNLVPNADAPYMGWKPQPTFFQDIGDKDREVVKNLEYLSLFNHEDRNKDDFQRSLYIGMLSGKKVVVKFCERYCPDAHRLLADHDPEFAPKLHMCTRLVGGQHMVVMDYVEGSMVSTAFREGNEVRLSLQFHDQVKTALDVLHEKGYVFGDLRAPNILKRTIDNRAMLIDFDWAGKEGEARYSVLMNTDLTWPKGASRGGLIHKQHDWDMLARMYPGRVEEGTVEEGTVEEGTGRIERVEEGVSRVAKHTLEDGDGGSSSRRLRTDGDGLDSIEDPEDIMEVDVEAQ
ncbi:hypothetical protein FA95DRAFT_1514638 [Auriscalpium vulgare]|uniref:Uncharacterized protein n=1 Tax=Auriscalpium vulgare TaxID=40419 RepID=A0ACB8S1H5_9AGAM|nr:hypothetical protein FA95DRAFT_1514638 [Auriscalpium vulgare]